MKDKQTLARRLGSVTDEQTLRTAVDIVAANASHQGDDIVLDVDTLPDATLVHLTHLLDGHEQRTR